MAKIFIPGESPLFQESDVIPQAVRSVPMRAMVELTRAEPTHFDFGKLLQRGITPERIVEELARRGVDVTALVGTALEKLFQDESGSVEPQLKIARVTEHVARIGGPVSSAVRNILIQ